MGHSDPVFKLHTEASVQPLFIPESSADIPGAYQSRKAEGMPLLGATYIHKTLFEFFF